MATGKIKHTIRYVRMMAVPLNMPKALIGMSGLNPFAKNDIAVVLEVTPPPLQEVR